jgi:hypothetical protein
MFPGWLGLCLTLAAVNGLTPLWALKLLMSQACLPPDLHRLSVNKFLQLGFFEHQPEPDGLILAWGDR